MQIEILPVELAVRQPSVSTQYPATRLLFSEHTRHLFMVDELAVTDRHCD
jgi:hypothetical protein